MKLLALKTGGTARPFIHKAVVRALRSLGEDVIDRPVPTEERDLVGLDREIRKTGIQAVFALDMGASPLWISRVKELQGRWRIPFLTWFVDDPEGYGFPDAVDPHWTSAFCWDRRLAAKWNRARGIWMEHLPLATDPDIFRPVSAMRTIGGVFVGAVAHPNPLLEEVIRTNPDVRQTAWRISWRHRDDFGTSLRDLLLRCKPGWPEDALEDPLRKLWFYACLHEAGRMKRRMVVEEVLGEKGRVYGPPHWREILRRATYGGTLAYGEPLCQTYGQGVFVLETRQPQAPSGLTQRIFDASACAAAVLAEWSEELEFLYDPEEECLTFRTLEEGREMARLLLECPQMARCMALKARRRSLAHHTYRHRAESLRERLRILL